MIAPAHVPSPKAVAGKWHDVEAAPDAFICNVGDMLEYWSAGRFKSTRHRVLKPTDEERYSCGFFACPNHDAVVCP